MDLLFVSMPYAKFDSKWFANVPNINLALVHGWLSAKGRDVKTFQFHLDFLPYLDYFDEQTRTDLIQLSAQFGVEYLGLDYVFASLLFQERYLASQGPFQDRLRSVGLSLDRFEKLREVAESFVGFAYSKLSSFLEKAKVVGFTCSHYQLSGSLLMCSKIKNSHPEVLSVFGGKDCSGTFARELLTHMTCVDFVGTGECEVTIDSLLSHIDDKGEPFYNLLYRDPDGNIAQSESKQNVELDSMPFPLYDFDNIRLEPGALILPLELGRGCPWKQCTFCPDASYNMTCQSKTAARVRQEIDYYQSISDALTNYIVLDSDALKDPDVVIELSEYLDGKGLSFHFGEFRAERMTRKVLVSLLRFGRWVSPFQVGIETFSDRVLRLMNKGVTALKNVEVLKMVAELGVPLQFNLFTCYPNMSTRDLEENLTVMDRISHLLVYENIQMFPGEFYLPADCPVFLHMDRYGLRRHVRSIFADIFEDFSMPSYSNYPYPYQFDNDEEQFRMAQAIRAKVQDIKRRTPQDDFMSYEESSDGLDITVCRDGKKNDYRLTPSETALYLAAVDKVQRIDRLSVELGIDAPKIDSMLANMDRDGLILLSPGKRSFISLAMVQPDGV